MSERDVFTAIADPTRREILSLLRDRRDVAAGDIADRFPGVTRPAISRHLRVLRECDVVRVERRGKHQHYSLEPEPLRELRDGWLADFSRQSMKSLSALRRAVED